MSKKQLIFDALFETKNGKFIKITSPTYDCIMHDYEVVFPWSMSSAWQNILSWTHLQRLNNKLSLNGFAIYDKGFSFTTTTVATNQGTSFETSMIVSPNPNGLFCKFIMMILQILRIYVYYKKRENIECSGKSPKWKLRGFFSNSKFKVKKIMKKK